MVKIDLRNEIMRQIKRAEIINIYTTLIITKG